MTAAPATTWVTLQTFDSVPLADLARVQLESAGIPCRLLNKEVVSMDWLLGNAVGYIPLQVPEDQLEAADRALGGASMETDLTLSEFPKCGEPLDGDGPCRICGHDVDTKSPSARTSEPSEEPREDPEDEDDRPSSLEGLRNLGKSAISAYLVVVFLMMIASAFGTMMILLNRML